MRRSSTPFFGVNPYCVVCNLLCLVMMYSSLLCITDSIILYVTLNRAMGLIFSLPACDKIEPSPGYFSVAHTWNSFTDFGMLPEVRQSFMMGRRQLSLVSSLT